MKYEIWQITAETQEARQIRFSSYQLITEFGLKPTRDIYSKVYESEIDDDKSEPWQILEFLFMKFQGVKPEGYTGCSLSVSDVVILDGVSYYVDSIGFQKIDF